MLHRIPAWSGSDRGRLIAHPKHLLFDLGVRNALRRRPLDRPLDDDRGTLLEHLVGLELVRRQGTLWPGLRVFHSRTSAGAEVDDVVDTGSELWGVEVKANSRVRPASWSGLRSLAARVKLARQIVVFLGERPQRVGDVEVLPLRTFLDELPT